MLIQDLVDEVLAGRTRAMARAISLAEEGGRPAREMLKALRASAGRAHVVGVTGSPGAGKSTLINRLVKEFRNRGRMVGVIAVDPTSPFTGGAILGDRVRMQELAGDPGVFIRSMATRGRLGGLARATEDAVTILDAAGKDLVVVETVGVGQDEVDVAAAAHTTLVVVVPRMGDDIQALKAGVLEVADVFVVNKADLDGSDRAALELATLSSLNGRGRIAPVVKTVATTGSGLPELADAIETHRASLIGADAAAGSKTELVRKRIMALAERDLSERLQEAAASGQLERLVGLVVAGHRDPDSAAEELVRDFLAGNLTVL